jgi:hypothetical protein
VFQEGYSRAALAVATLCRVCHERLAGPNLNGALFRLSQAPARRSTAHGRDRPRSSSLLRSPALPRKLPFALLLMLSLTLSTRATGRSHSCSLSPNLRRKFPLMYSPILKSWLAQLRAVRARADLRPIIGCSIRDASQPASARVISIQCGCLRC